MEDTKHYTDLALKTTPYFSEIEKALDVAKEFIKEKDLVLYGGESIDYALKKAGHQGIYGEGNIPDYDCLSPNYNEDSRDLAQLLLKKGFENISDINAVHFYTRRVRVQYEPVGDISYIPKIIFDKLPTLKYNDLRFVHPNYQRMDMHKELSYPFENPSREVVLHRSAKTIKRFKMLNEVYPIRPSQVSKPDTDQKITIPISFTTKNVLGGFAAYGLIYAEFESLFMGKSKKLTPKLTELLNKLKKDIIPAKVSYQTKEISVNIEVNAKHLRLNLYSDDFTEFGKLGNTEYYNSFMETLRPRTLIISPKKETQLEIFDTRGSILPCYLMKSDKGTPIKICSAQLLLLYFLQKDFELQNNLGLYQYLGSDTTVKNEPVTKPTKNPNKDETFIRFYLSLSNMIIFAEHAYEDNLCALDAPFFLNVSNLYGSKNYTGDYVTWLKDKVYTFNKTPFDEREVLRPPFGYYPDTSVRPEPFKFQDSEYYMFDGQKRDKPFTHKDLNNLKI